MRASFNITINNTIVKESNARIKSLARYALKGNWTVSVCVVAICTTLMNLPAYLSNYLPPVEGFDLAGFALTLLSVALMGACTLSMQSYFLKLQRMEGPGLDSLAAGVRNYPKALILGAVQFLLMMLSTFSLSGYGFLIGIMSVMALFRYILAYYILLDEPRQSPIRILSKSNYLMFGNKARMASLLISFIGWFLLASLLSSCVQYLMFPGLVDEIRQAAQIMVNSDMQTASEAFSQMDMTSLIASERSIAFAVIKNIISAAPYAYVFTSAACFYDYAAGNLVTQTGGEADPVSPFAPSAAVIDPEDEPSENNYE